jgi:hypothetical protein
MVQDALVLATFGVLLIIKVECLPTRAAPLSLKRNALRSAGTWATRRDESSGGIQAGTL